MFNLTILIKFSMQIKRAARTVIVDGDLIALIEVKGGEYYKIPGGGVEGNETDIEAAKREALEEAGCEVEIGQKIDENEFVDNNPEFGETCHQSICFLAKRIGDSKNTSFDTWEQSNNMRLIWVSFPKAIELFSKATVTDFFGSQINKRDYEFVIKVRDLLMNRSL